MENEQRETLGEVSLKPASTEDIPAILEVEKGLVGTKIYSGLTGAEDAEKELAENFYYLIEKAGKVVGDISYKMQADGHAYINGLAVAKEFQRQGIGRQAMKKLLEILGDVKLIDLVTHPENKNAIKLYKSLGFRQIGEIMENYFNDGEPRIKMQLEREQ